MRKGDRRLANLFNEGTTVKSLAFGGAWAVSQGNNQFTFESNEFNFEWWVDGSFARNAFTVLGGIIVYTPSIWTNWSDASFEIVFRGKATIPE